MNYKYPFFAFIGIVLFIFSCSKEEDLSNTQMISTGGGKEWITEVLLVDTTDITKSMASCERDDIYKFYTDHTYEFHEGDTACFEGDSTILTGTWYMNDVQTILELAIDKDTTEYIVRELEKGKMKLFYIDQKSGTQYLWTLKPR